MLPSDSMADRERDLEVSRDCKQNGNKVDTRRGGGPVNSRSGFAWRNWKGPLLTLLDPPWSSHQGDFFAPDSNETGLFHRLVRICWRRPRSYGKATLGQHPDICDDAESKIRFCLWRSQTSNNAKEKEIERKREKQIKDRVRGTLTILAVPNPRISQPKRIAQQPRLF